MTDLISNLQWRYATKKMNPAKSVPENKVARIVEAVRLSPSANGLQPYQVIVVSNKAVLEKLKVARGNVGIVKGTPFSAGGRSTNQSKTSVLET